MPDWLELPAAFLIFALGLRLSAFFSGSETGFYRVSYLRVSIAAHEGDRAAQRILWFTQNPGYFVATTLIGNNVANYLTTVAIGMAAAVYTTRSGWTEIVSTLLVSPVVFIFGELLPKNLYYRAPLHLLRRDSLWFLWFYRAFLVVSWPLNLMSRLLQRWGDPSARPLALLLGRSRLVQVFKRGHEEGLLTEVQNRLVSGVMQTAPQPIGVSVTPAARVLGMADDASRQALLDFARRFGLTHVAVRRAGTQDEWYAYARTSDLIATQKPVMSLFRPMPRIDAAISKLETILALREAGAPVGVVYAGSRLVGTVTEHGLVEQLFRSPQALAPAV